MREEAKMTTTENLSPSTINEFVGGVYKDSDKTLGEIVTLAEQYENELNAWNDKLDLREDLEDGR
jgi:hypothetical protein